MRLRRLRLEHFRGVSERTVEFADTGLTVIVAANESGKSSLLEALDLLFALPDDSRAARLRAVQPVGQDVATEVEAELELDGRLLTYRKRWFRKRVSELTVRSAGGSGGSRSFIGREAHDEAGRLFSEGVDQTLWSALVAAQGTTATVPVAGSVAAVLTALDAVAGAEGSTADDTDADATDAGATGAGGGPADHRAAAPLLSAVEREYLTYFTPTGRPTGEHAAVLRRTEELDTALSAAEQRLAETREDVARAERLEAERDALAASLAERENELAALGQRQESTAELRGTVERLATEHELATARAQAADRAAAERRSLVAELEHQVEAAEAAERTAAEQRSALRVEEQEAEAAATELRAARERLAECRAETTRATSWWERRRDHAELAALTEQLEAVTGAQEAERAALAALGELSVDADRMDEIEAAHREVLTRRAALEAGAPTIVVRRLGDAPITVAAPRRDSDDVETEAEVEAPTAVEDDSTELTVERRLSVRVGEQAEVEVRPGDGVSALTAEVRRAEHELAELLAAADVTDVAAARAVARRHAEQQRAAAEAGEAVRRHAAGTEPAQLRARWEELRLRCARAEDTDPDDAAPDPVARADGPGAQLMLVSESTSQPREFDLGAAERAVERAREDEAAAARRVAEAEQAEVRARKGLESASESATSARVRAEQAADRRAELSDRLTAARAEHGDDALEEAAGQAAEHVARLAETHASATAELTASGADRLVDEHTAAAASVEQLRAQVAEARDTLRHLEGRLEMAGQHGLASQVDQLQAEQAEAERERERIVRRAAAAARLRDTVERHRSQARSRYAAPLRERIERLGRVLHDDSFSVALGEQLEVTSRELGGVALPLASLSLGAREQLAVLVRLAIAELTARDGNGVPVLLDDALGWSDPSRLRAMGGLLAHAAEQTQVVVLTCVAERYAGLPGVQLLRW